MPWFKVDDTLWSHPKFAALTDAAQALWLRTGSYSAEKLTDGVVSEQIVMGLLRGKKRTVDELVGAGLWRRTPEGVEFHDWLEYQPSAEAVKRSREQARERMRNVRANRRGSSPSPDPVPDPVPKTDITNSHNHVELVDVRAEETDEDFIASEVGRLGVKSFPRVRKAFARVGVVGSDAELVDLARQVLDLSTDHVRSPEAYVETVCRDSPATVTGLWGRVRLPEGVA